MASAELKAIFSGDTSGLRSAVSDAEAELARLKKAGGGDLIGELKGGESWSSGLQNMGSVSKIRRDWAGLGEELAGMKSKSQTLAAEWPTLREQIGSSAVGIQAASGATNKFAAELAGAKGGAGAMRDAVMSLAGPMLGIAGITMGARFITDGAAYAGAIQDAANRTGMSVRKFQELQYAAKQTGTDMGAVENAFRRLQSIVGGDITDQQESAFTRLGLSVEYLRTLSPDQLFDKVASKLKDIPDPTQKAAIAVDIFGKSGTMILPMANDMQRLAEEANKLGIVMGDDVIKNGDKFDDFLEVSKLSLKAYALDVLNLGGHLKSLRQEMTGGPGKDKADPFEKTTEKEAYEAGAGAYTAQLRRAREAKAALAKKEQEDAAKLSAEQAKLNAANAAQDAKFAAADLKEKEKRDAEAKKEHEKTSREIMDAAKKLAEAKQKLAEARKDKAEEAVIKGKEADVKKADNEVTAAEKRLKAIQEKIAAADKPKGGGATKVGRSILGHRTRGLYAEELMEGDDILPVSGLSLKDREASAKRALAAAQAAKERARTGLDAARESLRSNKSEDSLGKLVSMATYWQKTLEVLQQRLPGGA